MAKIKNEFSSKQIWLLFYLTVMIIFLIDYVGLGNYFRLKVELLLRPVNQLSLSLGSLIRTPYEILRNSYSSTQRIKDLESRYSQSLAIIGQLEAVKEENMALREMIGSSDRKINQVVISAPIISYGKPYVGVGSDDGVKSGSCILASQSLVGRVGKVTPHQAEVILLSQQASEPILVKTLSGVQGIIVGDGKRIVMKEIGKNDVIKINDQIVTVGQVGVEKDLLVGKVSYVINEAELATQEVYVEQVATFFESRLLEVRN